MQITGIPQNGVNAAIGNAAVKLSAISSPLVGGIVLQTPSTNTQTVYVGGLGVTTANGLAMAPNTTSQVLPFNDPSLIYVIATSGTQSMVWAGG